MREGVELCSDILNAIELIDHHFFDFSPPLLIVFRNAYTPQDAIIYRLMVIGEAAGGLLSRYGPSVASLNTAAYDLVATLRAVRQMRDKLIHHYWKLDPRIVFQTVVQDLPALKNAIERLRLILTLS